MRLTIEGAVAAATSGVAAEICPQWVREAGPPSMAAYLLTLDLSALPPEVVERLSAAIAAETRKTAVAGAERLQGTLTGVAVESLVGHRALVSFGGWGRGNEVIEVLVMEVSPRGQWVRLRKDGRVFWKAVTEVRLVETLRDLRPAEPRPAEVRG